MNESSNRIWQPVVQPNENPLPQPGSSNQQHQVYTKTSLVSQNSSRHYGSLRNLNRDILSASQAYNNTPKPFRATGTQSPSLNPHVGVNIEPRVLATSVSDEHLDQQQHQRQQQVKYNSSIQHQRPAVGFHKEPGFRQEQSQACDNRSKQSIGNQEEMAPQKLVHNQYNSPIDLYSMNNIRKTIEAHTELIAPGLKGINFMKPDTPINKQSEVYKLVKEEEERARSQQGSSSRLSPISGQPLNLPTALTDQTQYQRCQQVDQAAQQHTEQQQEVHQQVSSGAQSARSGSGAPTCCECGQFILGTFAKIQNRFVHPQCFNCTTCGTSLKNTGYFTVNEKLYCDIHAKQVANMMHINYDFAATKQHEQQQSRQVQQQQQIHQSNQTQARQLSQLQQSTLSKQHDQVQQSHSSSTSNELFNQQQQRQQCSSSSNPATISTMFADRSNLSDTNSERREVRWAWQPVANQERANTSSTLRASSSLHQQQQQQEGNLRGSPLPTSQVSSQHQYQQQQQQQSMVSLGMRGRGLLQESSAQSGGRIPICVHCHSQIQGPYILAGKTTWCKQCSQNNFNCSSCRRSLLDIGFIEDNSHKYYCEHCFEAYYAPVCSKCNIRIKGDCLNALNKQWHPSCFVCGHCHRPFGNSSFYLEDNVPYCERDWNVLFTTKCYACSYPIEAGDKWIEALDRNYHSNCFRCTSCQTNLEGSTFYCKGGKPYCRPHAR